MRIVWPLRECSPLPTPYRYRLEKCSCSPEPRPPRSFLPPSSRPLLSVSIQAVDWHPPGVFGVRIRDRLPFRGRQTRRAKRRPKYRRAPSLTPVRRLVSPPETPHGCMQDELAPAPMPSALCRLQSWQQASRPRQFAPTEDTHARARREDDIRPLPRRVRFSSTQYS